MSGHSYILLLLMIVNLWARPATSCDVVATHPPQDIFKLSNGVEVPVPTGTQNFELQTVVGGLDLKKLTPLLAAHGLHPVILKGKGVGLLSFYFYRQSHVGSFAEVYFVTLASTRPLAPTFDTLRAITRMLSIHPDAPSLDSVLFHLAVFSGTTTAYLMSDEIWGIPSRPAEIVEGRSGAALMVNGEEWLRFKLVNRSMIPNPLAGNLLVYAVGEQRLFSPVESCGKVKFRAWSKQDRLVTGNNQLAKLLKKLKFSPAYYAEGQQLQAVQFLPAFGAGASLRIFPESVER